MDLWMLKETNSWTEGPRIIAVCTSVEKAVKMMDEWFAEEQKNHGGMEEITSKFESDGKYSFARIASKESTAWEELEIEEAWTNDWLNSY